MTNTIKQEKEQFLLRQLKNGERTGEYLEAQLRKQFPGQVTVRFRSEMDGLIKRGEVLRDGVGASAVFRLAKAGSRAKTNPVSPRRPVAAAKPAAVPTVPVPEPEPEFADYELTGIVLAVLVYLARNGARHIDAIRKKVTSDYPAWVEISVLYRMVQHGLVEEDENVLTLTRKGLTCLDNAHAEKSSQ